GRAAGGGTVMRAILQDPFPGGEGQAGPRSACASTSRSSLRCCRTQAAASDRPGLRQDVLDVVGVFDPISVNPQGSVTGSRRTQTPVAASRPCSASISECLATPSECQAQQQQNTHSRAPSLAFGTSRSPCISAVTRAASHPPS